MPPKARITKDMIINAAIEIAKQRGYESINARTVSERLHCSTQPVMYHFSTIDAMKRAAYGQVDHLHSEYMMTMKPEQDPILGIGLNDIRFVVISVAYCLYLAKRVETPAIHRAEPRQEPAPNTGKA